MTPVVITVSFSGNAFSVKNARGKFRSPRGHERSSQNDHRYLIVRSICSIVSAWPKAGMWRSSPRTGPPSWATATQSASGSTVLVAQSVKSGSECPLAMSKPTTLFGDPVPSAAWQVAQAAAKICSPVASAGMAGPVGAFRGRLRGADGGRADRRDVHGHNQPQQQR